MGALVGGLEAAGKVHEYSVWATSLTQRAVVRLLDPSIAAAGVLHAEKILDAVRDILGDVTIEELPVRFTAVCTDLIAGRVRGMWSAIRSAGRSPSNSPCWGRIWCRR